MLKRQCFSHKVLPLVYDESLSYYEVLCKLTCKINELIERLEDGEKNAFLEWLDENLEKLLINAMYKEPEKTIYFSRNTISLAGGCESHTYEVATESMLIKESDECGNKQC